MTRTLEDLDAIVHDPTQLTLTSFTTERGPYPAHPAGGRGE